MSHITVGVDGSKGSVQALKWAAAEACLGGYDLEILHALDIPNTGDVEVPIRYSTVTMAQLEKFSDDLLAISARTVAEVEPDLEVWTRSAFGMAPAVLINASREAARIVVGSRGLGALEGFIGSVGLKVAAKAKCPTFVIPGRASESATIGRIVVAVDDSECSLPAVRMALQEARLRNTSMIAINCYQLPMVSVPTDPDPTAPYTRFEHRRAVAMVEGIVDQARTDETSSVEVKVIAEEGPAVETILEYAQDAPLIVVGSHGRGRIGRVLLGSVSSRLLHQADRPVAVVTNPEDD